MATRPKTTVLDGDTLDAPQTTTPGDAPADTFDTTEHASSVTPDKATAGEAGYLSVNAVTLIDPGYVTDEEGEARTEQVYAYDLTGAQVVLDRDIITGETTPDEG